MICTKLLCANTFFYEDQLYIKLAKKICAKKKIICANEKKSASMKMLMPVLHEVFYCSIRCCRIR